MILVMTVVFEIHLVLSFIPVKYSNINMFEEESLGNPRQFFEMFSSS